MAIPKRKTHVSSFGTRNRRRVQVKFPMKEKRTEQNHARSCDINTIMARYVKTGVIDHINKHSAKYGDVSGADFTAAQLLVAEQKTVFEELPAYAREHFDNDVATYLEALQTDEGLEELRSVLHPSDGYDEKEELATEQLTAAQAEFEASDEAATETSSPT